MTKILEPPFEFKNQKIMDAYSETIRDWVTRAGAEDRRYGDCGGDKPSLTPEQVIKTLDGALSLIDRSMNYDKCIDEKEISIYKKALGTFDDYHGVCGLKSITKFVLPRIEDAHLKKRLANRAGVVDIEIDEDYHQ